MKNTQKLSFIYIFLLSTLPFLSFYHYAPKSDASINIITIFISSIIILPHLLFIQKIKISYCYLFIFIFIAIALICTKTVEYPGDRIAGVTALLLSCLVGILITDNKKDYILSALAFGLLVGALLQCVIGYLQISGIASAHHLPFIVYNPSDQTALMGNIGQRNNLGNYLSLAFVSLCWIFAHSKLPKLLSYIFLAFICLFLSWTASRTVIIYSLGLMILSWVYYILSGREKNIGRMVSFMALGVLLIAFFQSYNDLVNSFFQTLGIPINQGSGVERFTSSGFGTRRIIEWQKAWHIFTENPWFGVGYGGYAAQSVALEAEYGKEWVINALFVHCHNFVLQLLAEFGLIGAFLSLATILLAFFPWFKRENINTNGLLILSMSMVILVHSQLEYPLWYASFLFIFSILIGLSPTSKITINFRPAYRYIISAFIIVILWQTTTSAISYMDWARWVQPSGIAKEDKHRINELLEDSLNPLWSYETHLILTNYFSMTNEQVDLKLPILERQAAYRPFAETLVKLAIIRAYNNDLPGALDALQLAIDSYPKTVSNISFVIYAAEGTEIDLLKEKLKTAGIENPIRKIKTTDR
ncbi:PglL family O-oligosaccharyltransferase [Parendozoicomonas haliclonae]|uniref:O-Antigen ligase n=1 Tax=Parendozoicomonas haliclonae TaxID=1960125 RepID=A0A1X7AQ97_9GAMM|nr:Wzy polymerase domain-containing protein [Parendozoicomonas haliclonae]SMA50292.1 O-Antigen ligase [Parendozoicomonas haliclonae]